MWSVAAMKHKRMTLCTINTNMVQGRSYKIFSMWKFVVKKFHNMKISISMVSFIIQTTLDLIEHCPNVYNTSQYIHTKYDFDNVCINFLSDWEV